MTHTGSSGSGAVTWALTSGVGVCSLSGTTVTAVANGACTLTVTIAADSVYESASSSVTINVATPGGGGSGGGGGSSDSTPPAANPATTAPSAPTPQSTGAVAFVPISEKPGEVGALIGGKSVSATVTSTGRNETLIRAGEIELGLKGQPIAEATSSAGETALVLNPGRPLEIAGDGIQPNSIVQEAIFSKPMQLDSSTTNAKGEFVASSRVPADLKAGNHTFQVTGRTKSGEPFVLSLGVVAMPAAAAAMPATAAMPRVAVRFDTGSFELPLKAKWKLSKLVAQSKGKEIKRVRIDGRLDVSSALAQGLGRGRMAAIVRELRNLGVRAKVNSRVVPVNEANDPAMRTYKVSLRVS